MTAWLIVLCGIPIVGTTGLYFHRLIYGKGCGLTPLAGGAISWGSTLLLYLWNPLHFYALTDHAWLILAMATCSFAFGYAVTTLGSRLQRPRLPPHEHSPQWAPEELRPIRRLWALALFVTIALFAEYLFYVVHTYGLSSLHTILFQLRTQESQHGAPTFGFYFFYAAELLVPLSVVLALGYRSRRRQYISVAVAASAALLTTSGRTNATIAIIWALAVMALFWGGRRLKVSRLAILGLGAVTLLVLFLLLGAVIGKTYANSTLAAEFGDNPPIPSLLVEPYFYVSSPLADFSQVVSQPSPHQRGENSFREVLQVAHLFDRQIVPPPLVEAYHYIPYPDNVSTSITPFWNDFGTLGVIVGEVLVGSLLAAAFWVWSVRRTPASLVLAAMATLVALTSTGPAQYNQPSWIIQALLLCLVLSAERRALRSIGSGVSDDSPSALPTVQH